MLFIIFVLCGALSARSFTSRDLSQGVLPLPPNNTYLGNNPWIPAALIANSSRSPCPMLNTLANHGLLPRDGRNISKSNLNSVQVTALNMTPELANKTTEAMVAKLETPKNESAAFDLEDFNAHNFTEHDASLTRLDLLQGGTRDVQPSLVNLLLADANGSWLDAASIGRSRARRESESRSIGTPRLSDAFTGFAQLESSFIILIFGVGGTDGKNTTSARKAPKEQVRLWLNEERFPVDKGYGRSNKPLSVELQAEIIKDIKKSHDALVTDYS